MMENQTKGYGMYDRAITQTKKSSRYKALEDVDSLSNDVLEAGGVLEPREMWVEKMNNHLYPSRLLRTVHTITMHKTR